MKEDIFIKLIHFFKIQNIEYCILGNVNDYPAKIGSDVDIVIDSRQFKKINSIVNQFLVSNDLEACNLLQHEIEGKYFVVSTINNKECNLVMLALDFCANYMVDGSIVLTDKELLASKKLIRNNGVEFWVCSDEIAFIYYLYKKIIKQSISKKQFEYLLKLWIQDRNAIIEQFHFRFRLDSCNKLISVFDTDSATILTPDFFKILKKETQKEHQKEHKKNLKLVILEFKRRVLRFINPTGVIIQILGNDETAKSDLANLIKENTKDFEAFRSISNLNLLEFNSKSNFKWLNFIYQFWFIVYPHKVRSKLVILDSYYSNLFNYNRNSNSFFKRILTKTIPKPDLFFVVDASFKISQQQILEKIILESEKLVFIDINSETKSIAFEIKKAIHNYLVGRYKEQNKEY